MEKTIVPRGFSSAIMPNLIGDSHRYKTPLGVISLIHPCMATMDSYEIYCLEGDLFEDVERFATLQEAEDRINELLKPNTFPKQ